MVSIVAFQAVDPGSIPGQRSLYFRPPDPMTWPPLCSALDFFPLFLAKKVLFQFTQRLISFSVFSSNFDRFRFCPFDFFFSITTGNTVGILSVW